MPDQPGTWTPPGQPGQPDAPAPPVRKQPLPPGVSDEPRFLPNGPKNPAPVPSVTPEVPTLPLPPVAPGTPLRTTKGK